METLSAPRSVKAFDLPLDRLAANPGFSKREKLDAAGRAFEAVLLRQILEDATRPVIDSGVTSESSSSAIYRDLITTQMSQDIARSGQLGLSQGFLEQLGSRRRDAASPAGLGRPDAGPGQTPQLDFEAGPLLRPAASAPAPASAAMIGKTAVRAGVSPWRAALHHPPHPSVVGHALPDAAGERVRSAENLP